MKKRGKNKRFNLLMTSSVIAVFLIAIILTFNAYSNKITLTGKLTYDQDPNNRWCEGDFDCDGDVDGTDASAFKRNFGRSSILKPCNSTDPCVGNFDCDQDVDGADAAKFKTDFGRSAINKPCDRTTYNCVQGIGITLCNTVSQCDVDGDGFSARNPPCNGTDCNDRNRAINPEATDICGNGVDENCNGGDAVCGCTPNCNNKMCGPDGCGGQCLPGCSESQVCRDGTCIIQMGIEPSQNQYCSEDDNGFDITKRGTTKGTGYYDDLEEEFTDFCIFGRTLIEYWCEPIPGTNRKYESSLMYDCKNGCSFGKCLNEITPTLYCESKNFITNAPEIDDRNIAGSVRYSYGDYGSYGTHPDQCLEEYGDVIESYCEQMSIGQVFSFERMGCENGCSEDVPVDINEYNGDIIYGAKCNSAGYSISGYVRNSGVGISNVNVSFGSAGSVKTNSNGFYNKTGLLNGTYRVVPSHPNYFLYGGFTDVTIYGYDITKDINMLKPTITSISPTSGNKGALVTINGNNFFPQQSLAEGKVWLVGPAPEMIECTIYNWSNSQIKVYVPSLSSIGPHYIAVQVRGVISNPFQFNVTSSLDTINPVISNVKVSGSSSMNPCTTPAWPNTANCPTYTFDEDDSPLKYIQWSSTDNVGVTSRYYKYANVLTPNQKNTRYLSLNGGNEGYNGATNWFYPTRILFNSGMNDYCKQTAEGWWCAYLIELYAKDAANNEIMNGPYYIYVKR